MNTTTDPTRNDKLRRYVIVTIVATPANLILYLGWLMVVGLPAVGANLAAATMVTIPAYFVHRRWVWRLDSLSSAAEAVQYWGSTALSVGASSAALSVLQASGARESVLAVAPLAVYAVLWIARYLFLDRYLFQRGVTSERSATQPGSGSTIGMIEATSVPRTSSASS